MVFLMTDKLPAAIANLLRMQEKPYKSDTERRWSLVGMTVVGAFFGGLPALEMYEPVTFHIPGGSYTPDFMYILPTGQTVFVEVKGSTKQKNYRDARAKLRASADIYRMFTFCEVRPERGTWTVEVIA